MQFEKAKERKEEPAIPRGCQVKDRDGKYQPDIPPAPFLYPGQDSWIEVHLSSELYQEREKTTDRMGEGFVNQIPDKGLTSRMYQKHFQLNHKLKKWAKDLNNSFLQRYTNDHPAHEKMLGGISYLENANQKHHEMQMHTRQDG